MQLEERRNAKRSQNAKTVTRTSAPRLDDGELGFAKLCDVSNLAGTTCNAYFGNKKTLPTNSRTLSDLGCKAYFVHSQRHTDDYSSYNIQQHPPHVCLHSQMSPVLEIQGWHAGWRRSRPPCIRETRETRRLSCLRFSPPVRDEKRCSPTSSTFWPQHRSSNEREDPQRMQVARAVAHGPARPTLRQECALVWKTPQNVDFLSTVFAPVPLAPDPQNTRRALVTRRPLVSECRDEATCLRPNVPAGHKVSHNQTQQKASHSKWNCSEHLNQPQPTSSVRQTDATKSHCCRITKSAPIGTPLTPRRAQKRQQ